MKFNVFTPDTCISTRGNSADDTPRFAALTTGIFSFGKHAVSKMSLSEGDKVIVVQDKANTCDWYVCKATGKEPGFTLRRSTAGKGTEQLMFNSVKLRQEILTSLSRQKDTKFRGTIGDSTTINKVDYWPLIILPAQE